MPAKNNVSREADATNPSGAVAVLSPTARLVYFMKFTDPRSHFPSWFCTHAHVGRRLLGAVISNETVPRRRSPPLHSRGVPGSNLPARKENSAPGHQAGQFVDNWKWAYQAGGLWFGVPDDGPEAVSSERLQQRRARGTVQ